MRVKTIHFTALLLFSTIIVAGSGCDDTLDFANTPPSGLSISRDICYLGPSDIVTLTGEATDNDGDEISYRWTAGEGTLSPADGKGQVVTWRAPDNHGTYRVTLRVTDSLDETARGIDLDVGRNLEVLHEGGVLDQTDYPYIVPNSLPILIGEIISVTIEAGVTIVFNEETGGFQVEGTLNINGTADNRVAMIPNSCPGEELRWKGIKMMGDMAAGTWSHVTLTSTVNGLDMEDGAILTADNLIFDQARHNAISVKTGSSLNIIDSRIWENGDGIYVLNSALDIRNSSIRYNGNYGFNIVTNTGPTDVTILDCTIANNAVYGFLLGIEAKPVVHNCSMFINGQLPNIKTVVFSSSYTNTDDVDMTGNWWGGATSTDIQLQIIREGTNGIVDYSNWLTEEP